MEKQLTITVHNAAGEEGLTNACKRGDLFRNDSELDKYFRQGYRIHDYSIEGEERISTISGPHTRVRVFLKK